MKVSEIIGDIGDLPTLPQVVTQLMALLNDPNSTAEDVTEVMARDVALAAKVLKIANSSFYGLTQKVVSVKQGIVVLGFSVVKSLAISAAVFDVFSSNRGLAFNREDFWLHSSACAYAARYLAENKVKGVDPEAAFMAGLLHDIGIMVLDQFAEEKFEEILDISLDEDLSYDEAEQEVLGTHHGAIGAAVAQHWQLPPELISAIEFHRSLAPGAVTDPLTKLVHLADFVCDQLKIGSSGGIVEPALGLDTLEILGLDPNDEDAIVAELKDALSSVNSLSLANS